MDTVLTDVMGASLLAIDRVGYSLQNDETDVQDKYKGTDSSDPTSDNQNRLTWDNLQYSAKFSSISDKSNSLCDTEKIEVKEDIGEKGEGVGEEHNSGPLGKPTNVTLPEDGEMSFINGNNGNRRYPKQGSEFNSEETKGINKLTFVANPDKRIKKSKENLERSRIHNDEEEFSLFEQQLQLLEKETTDKCYKLKFKNWKEKPKKVQNYVKNKKQKSKVSDKTISYQLSSFEDRTVSRNKHSQHHHNHHRHHHNHNKLKNSQSKSHHRKHKFKERRSDSYSDSNCVADIDVSVPFNILSDICQTNTHPDNNKLKTIEIASKLESELDSELAVARKPECEVKGVEEDNDKSKAAADKYPINYNRCYRLQSAQWECSTKCALRLLKRKYRSVRHSFAKEPVIILNKLSVDGYKMIGDNFEVISMWEAETDSSVCTEDADGETEKDELEDGVNLVDPRVMSLSRTLQSGQNGKVGAEKTFRNLSSKHAEAKTKVCFKLQAVKNTNIIKKPVIQKPDWSVLKQKLKEVNDKQILQKKKDAKNTGKDVNRFVKSKQNPFHDITGDHRKPEGKWESNKSDIIDESVIQERKRELEKLCTRSQTDNEDMTVKQVESDASTISNKLEEIQEMLSDSDVELDSDFKLDGYSIEICQHSTDDDQSKEPSVDRDLAVKDIKTEHMEGLNRDVVNTPLRVTSGIIPNLYMSDDIKNLQMDERSLSPPVLVRESDEMSIVKAEIMLDQYRYIIREESDINNEQCDENVDNDTHLDNSTIVEDESKSKTMEICAEENVPSDSVNTKSDDTCEKSESDMKALEVKTLTSGENAQNLSSQSADSKQKSNSADSSTQELSKSNSPSHIEPSTSTSYEAGTDILQSHSTSTSSESGTQVLQSNLSFSLNDAALSDSAETLNYSDLIDEMTSQNSDNPYDTDTDTELEIVEEEEKLSLEKEHNDLNKKTVDSNSIRSWRNRSITPSSSSDNESVISDYKTRNTQTIDRKTETSAHDNQNTIKTSKKFCIKNSNKDNDCDQNEHNEPVSQSGTMRTKLQEMDIKQNTAGSRQDSMERSALARQYSGSEERERPGKLGKKRKQISNEKNYNQQELDDLPRISPPKRRQRPYSVGGSMPTKDLTQERLMHDLPNHNWLFNKYSSLSRERAAMERNGAEASSHVTMVDKVPSHHLSQRASPSKTSIPVNRFLSVPATIPETFSAERSRQSITQSITQYVGHVEREDKGQYQGQPKMMDGGFKADKINLHYGEDSAIQPVHSMGKTVKHVDVKNDNKIMNQTASSPPLSTHLSKMIEDKYRDLTQKVNLTKNIGEFAETPQDNSDAMECLGNATANQIKAIGDQNCDKQLTETTETDCETKVGKDAENKTEYDRKGAAVEENTTETRLKRADGNASFDRNADKSITEKKIDKGSKKEEIECTTLDVDRQEKCTPQKAVAVTSKEHISSKGMNLPTTSNVVVAGGTKQQGAEDPGTIIVRQKPSPPVLRVQPRLYKPPSSQHAPNPVFGGSSNAERYTRRAERHTTNMPGDSLDTPRTRDTMDTMGLDASGHSNIPDHSGARTTPHTSTDVRVPSRLSSAQPVQSADPLPVTSVLTPASQNRNINTGMVNAVQPFIQTTTLSSHGRHTHQHSRQSPERSRQIQESARQNQESARQTREHSSNIPVSTSSVSHNSPHSSNNTQLLIPRAVVPINASANVVLNQTQTNQSQGNHQEQALIRLQTSPQVFEINPVTPGNQVILVNNTSSVIPINTISSRNTQTLGPQVLNSVETTQEQQQYGQILSSSQIIIAQPLDTRISDSSGGMVENLSRLNTVNKISHTVNTQHHTEGNESGSPVTVGTDSREGLTDGGTNTGEQGSASDDDEDFRRQMEEIENEIKRKQKEQDEIRRKKMELLEKRKAAKYGVKVKTEDAEKERIKDEMDSAEIPDSINVNSINSENEANNEHTLNNESVDSDVTETSTHHYEPNNNQSNAGQENNSRRNTMINNDIEITSTEQNPVPHIEIINSEEIIGTNTDTKTSSAETVTIIGEDTQNDLSNNTAANTKTQMTTPSFASHAEMKTRNTGKTETTESSKVCNNYNVDIEDEEEEQFEGALVIDLSATSKEYGTVTEFKTRDLSSAHKSAEEQIKTEELNTIKTSDENDLDNKKEIKDDNERENSSHVEAIEDEQPFQNKNEIVSDNSIQYIEDIGRVNPFTGEYEYFDDNEGYNESLDLTNKSNKDKANRDKESEGARGHAAELNLENKPDKINDNVSSVDDKFKAKDMGSDNTENTQYVDDSNGNIFSDVQNQSNNFNDAVNLTGNDDVNGLDLSSKPICVFTFKKEEESSENHGQTSSTGNNDGKGNSDQFFTSHTDISDTSQHDKVTNSSMETSQNRNIRRNSRKYSEESSIITQTVASAALSALNPKGIKQEVKEPIVDKSPETQVESDNIRSVKGMQNVSQSDSLTTASELTSYESRMLVDTVNQRSQNVSLNTSQTVKTEPKQMYTEQSMDLSMNINRQTVPASSIVTSTSEAIIPTQSSVHMSTCVSQSVVYSTVHGKTSVSSSSPLTTSPTGNTVRKPYREIRCKPPPPDNVSLVTQANTGSTGVNVQQQQQQRQLQTPPHSIRQALQVGPTENNRNLDQENVPRQRQRSMDMAGVLPFQCGTSAFGSERRNPMARGWRPYPGAQQPQRRTRGMYIELEPAHTKPRQKKIPRNAKPSQAHSHVINMKEVFKKMNKSQCPVPATIQQSSPYFKRKVPVHQSAEDILITEEKMKNDERTIKPAHCQKPFSIAGQLIVSKKRGYKRSASRMTISPSPTRFSSVPNTPTSTPEEMQRSSSAMADIPVRHDNSFDASLPSQRSNSLEPSCPARAHAALDIHGDNNNFSTLQVLKPPTSCNIRDRSRSSTSDSSGVIDLTRLESPKLEIVEDPTPTQVSHANKETEVQNELTAALAKRQRLDPSIQEPARNSSRNSRGGIQSPNDRDSNVNNPINTQMSPQIQSSDIRMQKPVMRALPPQPLRHPGYSRYRQVLCPVPTDRSHRPEVGPYPLLNQDIHAQSTHPHGVHRQGEAVNEHFIQRMEMASNEYYRQRIDNRIKEREQQRFDNRTNDNFAQQMDNRSIDPKTQRMDANQMHSANRNTFDRIAQRMELTQTQSMDRSLNDRVTQRMDNRMSDRTLAQHLDNPSRDRLHQSINQQQQPPRLIQPSNRQFHNAADMPYGPHMSSNLERTGNRAPSQRQEMMNLSDPAFSHASGMYPPVRQGLERMQLHAQRTIQGIERARQEYASVEMRRQQQNSILNQQFMSGQQDPMQTQQNISGHNNSMQNQQNMSGQNPNITAHLHGMHGQQHQNMSGHNRNMSGPHGDAIHGPGQLKDLVQQNNNRQMLMQQSMQNNRVDPTPNWTQLQKMQQIRANHIRNRQIQQNSQTNREVMARHGNPGMGQVSPQEHFDQVQAGWQAGFPPHTAPPHTAPPPQTGNFQNIEQALRRQPHFQRPHVQQQAPGMHANFRGRHPGDLIGARQQIAPPTGKFYPTGSQETQFISTNNPMVANNHHNQIIQSNHNRLQALPSHHQATPTYHQAQHLHQQVTPTHQQTTLTHQQAPLTHQQALPTHQHTQIEAGLHNQGHVNQMHQTPPTRTIEGSIGQEQPIRKKSPKMSSGQMSAFSPSTCSTSHFQGHTGQGQTTDTSTQSGHQGLTQIHAPMRLKVDISPDQAAQSDEESMPHLQQVHGTCVLCGKYSLYLCSSCKKIWYCSPECQLMHWQTHVNDCKGPDG